MTDGVLPFANLASARRWPGKEIQYGGLEVNLCHDTL